MSGDEPTHSTRLDCTLLYRTFRSVCAFRGLSAPEGCTSARVPYSSLRKMSPDRSSGQLPPTADNLLRMLLWMDPDCDLAQYATEHTPTDPV